MNESKPDAVIVGDMLLEAEPVTFHDLPKPRQVRALQAYSESFRQTLAAGSQRGGTTSRRMRRAHASIARRK